MSPSKLSSGSVKTAQKAGKGNTGSVKVGRVQREKAAVKPGRGKAASAKQLKKGSRANIQIRQGDEETVVEEAEEWCDEDSEEGKAEKEGAGSLEERKCMKKTKKEGKCDPQRLPVGDGIVVMTPWKLFVATGKNKQNLENMAELTRLGCCGLWGCATHQMQAYFPSEESLQVALRTARADMQMDGPQSHTVWLTKLPPVFNQQEALAVLQAACPAAGVLRVNRPVNGAVKVIIADADGAQALAALGGVELGGHHCALDSAEQYVVKGKLRVYGCCRFRKLSVLCNLVSNAVRKPLTEADVPNTWNILGPRENPCMALSPLYVEAALEALAKCRWGNEVLLVRRWNDPVFGAALEDLPDSVTDEDIAQLLTGVTAVRMVLLPEHRTAVVYLPSEEERQKVLAMHQTQLKGERICIRIIDNQIHRLRTQEGSGENDAEASLERIPNSNGLFIITPWKLIFFRKRLQLLQRIAELTSLGCCGFQQEESSQYRAYFESEEKMKMAFLSDTRGKDLMTTPVHKLWLTNVPLTVDRKQALAALRSACPAACIMRVRKLKKGTATIVTVDADSIQALLAMGDVEIAGQRCTFVSAQDFENQRKLRIYGVCQGGLSVKRVKEMLEQPLREAGVPDGWSVYGGLRGFWLLLNPWHLKAVQQALGNKRCGDEVLLVRLWKKPVFGVTLENLAEGVTDEDIAQLLTGVTAVRTVLLPEHRTAVVYLPSEEERQKVLSMHQTQLKGRRICVRIIDNQMHKLSTADVAAHPSPEKTAPSQRTDRRWAVGVGVTSEGSTEELTFGSKAAVGVTAVGLGRGEGSRLAEGGVPMVMRAEEGLVEAVGVGAVVLEVGEVAGAIEAGLEEGEGSAEAAGAIEAGLEEGEGSAEAAG